MPVASIACKRRDTISFITADGREYYLDPLKDAAIISAEGEGMPPIEYITQRGPFQHGETMLDYFLKPRTLQYIIRRNTRSRSDYWDARDSLLNMLRPNRAPVTSLGKLRRYRANGTVRQLDAAISDGPAFAPRAQGGWDEWSYQEALRFTAFDPVWYDPTQKSLALTVPATTQLVFPITFPITFSDELDITGAITYLGTWLSYPIIMVTGPLTGLTIVNTITGDSLQLLYEVPPGVIVTFDTTYGSKTITDSLGNNLIGYLSSDSDLATFHIEPAPVAPGGLNTITVSGSGRGLTTAVQMTWYERYIGI